MLSVYEIRVSVCHGLVSDRPKFYLDETKRSINSSASAKHQTNVTATPLALTRYIYRLLAKCSKMMSDQPGVLITAVLSLTYVYPESLLDT